MGGDEPAPAAFYDELAEAYHLIFRDWDEAIGDTGEVLQRVLAGAGLAPPAAVLDCTCGIGTQAVALALRGYRVHGTDLSARSVDRARTEAARRGVEVSFGVADVRDLSALGSRRFDAVVSCDNSLSHLLTEADLVRGLGSIRDRLRPGGLLVASIRDYDELLGGGPAPALRHGQGSGPDDRGRPPGTLPQVFDSPHGRRVVVQVWTWDPVDPVYDLELFLLLEHGEGWRASSFRGRYRAYRRSDVDAALAGAGFTEPRWLMPEDSGYHQPLVRARAPG